MLFCQEAVLWIDRSMVSQGGNTKVIAYLEGDVKLQLKRAGGDVKVDDKRWFGRLFTMRDVQMQVPLVSGKPDVLPAVYQLGMDAWNPAPADALRHMPIEQAQYLAPQNELPPNGQPTPAQLSPAQPAPPQGLQPIAAPPPPGTRRVRVFPRGDVPMQVQYTTNPQSNQWTAVIEQGVVIDVDGLTIGNNALGRGPLSVDVSTDRLVIWGGSGQNPDLKSGPIVQNEQDPLEIYMEGNVVFRQGERTIYANRMYYDVRNNVGTVLDAEVLTPAPGYDGLLRLHAEVVQITSKDHFTGQNAFVTSSRLGVPRYSLSSDSITFDDVQTPVTDRFTGQTINRPGTSDPLYQHQQLVTASNDFIRIEDVPIFYFPYLATDVNDPSFLIKRIQFKDDTVFGAQFDIDLNAYQLFGVTDKPAGTNFEVSLDYLSLRGFAEGAHFDYKRDDIFGIPGPASGLIDLYGIDDHGTDNLGGGRGSVMPEPDVAYRYRVLAQHRQELGEGFEIVAEGGIISDRNFLQEYFKTEWDEFKDESSDVQLNYRHDDYMLSLFVSGRADPFFTETQWLPRGDIHLLGESLLADHLTLFDHTSLGYAQLKVASLPNSSTGDEEVSHLPWEANNRQGGRFVSRNEVDAPVELGVVKVVPYALGELGYWGEDINGDQLTRGYYQAGVRASLPLWAADSTVESGLWNVHGLAQKIEFDAEYLHAQSTTSVTDLPLYDQIDDNQIEDFRRRFLVNTFGLPVIPTPGSQAPPAKFDERLYAIRTDMEGWVEAPSMEIADNLDELKLGMHERWQTKRGPADDRHIVDWLSFDTDVTIYPDANRDNFGSTIGLIDYNLVWHIGDRTTFVSDGIFDTFGTGQKIVDIGIFLARPPRGNFYAGVRFLDGPIHNTVLTGSYNYWMSPKWVSSVGSSIDLTDTQNVGVTTQITRVGESLLIGGTFSYNPVLNTYSAGVTIEPRFVKSGPLGKSTGAQLPIAGQYGVE